MGPCHLGSVANQRDQTACQAYPNVTIISGLRFVPVPPGEISKTLLSSMVYIHGLSMYGASLTALGIMHQLDFAAGFSVEQPDP